MSRNMSLSDVLKRRPNVIRYFGLAVSSNGVHTWTAYGALRYIAQKHGPIKKLIVADLVRGIVFESPEKVEDFLLRWKKNYNNPKWDYKRDLDNHKPPGVD